MDEITREDLFKKALQATRNFLDARKDFEKVMDRPATDPVAVATAGRFIEAHEEMLAAIAAVEAVQAQQKD